MGAEGSVGAKIMVVEDEAKLSRLVEDYLRSAGYAPFIVADGREALPQFHAQGPALVLLDLMLPGRDGLDICRELRQLSEVPIIMVTARIEEIDRLLGLELGADDYVCKPFSPRELVARVKALLRRAGGRRPAYPSLFIDEKGYRASYRGLPLDLTPVEFRLLNVLASHPGRVFSRDRLLDAIYTDHRVVTDRTVDTHVRNLRRKLESVSPDHELIRSIYGVGYKFEEDDA